VIGNHDRAAIDPNERINFNVYAADAANWTEKNLMEESVAFLNNLPFTVSKNRFMFVHSSPHNPEEWAYILSTWDAKFQFSAFDQNICFIGHSHIPVIFSEKILPENKNEKYFFSQDGKYIINVGSIGQPRDRNPRLSFAIFNEDEWSIEYVRIDYDIKKAAGKILKAGLPSLLAERLFYGY
jgi:diadenosine tetraphosphatase ApaH/serine/threonine PP2A family protein phosphatase